MRALALVCLAGSIVACDILPKSTRPTSADSLPPPTPGIHDTMSDAAAAESAKTFARAEALRNAPMRIAISGAEHYAADSGFQVSCVASESNGERLLQVEALGRDVRLNFTVYNGRDGDVVVGNVYSRRSHHTRVGNVEVSVRTRNYADGTGHASITDPLGRTGSMSVGSFIKMGAKKHESHRTNLAVKIRWNCG
jgi:hypothetical protein